jgi:ubiquinone/menaquinone biosynthesis C-methylase UbiE
MTESTGQVSSDAARVYQDFFVPALFAQWAPRLGDAAGRRAGDTALDVACGTGVVTRELARRLGGAAVHGLDCNPGMLAVARSETPGVSFHEGLAEALPFEEGRFDAVVSAFGLMFFRDRTEALRQMVRVLRPGGRMVVAVWAALDTSPGYAAMVELLRERFGPEIADELRAPFVLGDRKEIERVFAEAGFAQVEVTTWGGMARFPSVDDWVRTDIRGWTLADRLDEAQFRELREAAPRALERFVVGEGRVEFEAPAHVAVVTKP